MAGWGDPLGLAQGWIRPYPMGAPQPWPLQLPPMVSRGPIQGDLQLTVHGLFTAVCQLPLLHTPKSVTHKHPQ